MISPARKVCFKILSEIASSRAFSDVALNSDAMLSLEVRDRHLTTEIVYGTLRWRALLDYVLASASQRPWRMVETGTKTLLRMSLYQMWKMDRIPEYALVNDAVELAKRECRSGTDSYVNGVLRRLARMRPWEKDDCLREAPDWVRVSLPKWLCDRWIARFGKTAALDFALSLNLPPRASLRVLSGKSMDAAELPDNYFESDLVPGAYIRGETDGTSAQTGEQVGAFQFQDEASQLIAHLLKPEPGWRVWDACAAPGGKTAILGNACGERGRVVASDLRKERMAAMTALLGRSGLSNVDALVADAGKSAPFRARFDAVLADVPCSGLGTLRRNPEIKWRFLPKELASIQDIQKEILHHVSENVRVGGRLLYSTCSTEPEENEQVVGAFLKAHPEFRLERPSYPAGIDRWTGRDRFVRTYPGKCLWDGFFAALMIRIT